MAIDRKTAIASAGRVFRRIRDNINKANARGGPEAIAEALWHPGHPMSKEDIAAHYEQLRREAQACAEERASRELGQ